MIFNDPIVRVFCLLQSLIFKRLWFFKRLGNFAYKNHKYEGSDSHAISSCANVKLFSYVFKLFFHSFFLINICIFLVITHFFLSQHFLHIQLCFFFSMWCFDTIFANCKTTFKLFSTLLTFLPWYSSIHWLLYWIFVSVEPVLK